MIRRLLLGTVIAISSLAIGCGGGADPATADDAASDAMAEGSEEAMPEVVDDAPSSGGIVRDADGDGVPDDQNPDDCASKNETQCKISAGCAWSDEGKCVDGGGM